MSSHRYWRAFVQCPENFALSELALAAADTALFVAPSASSRAPLSGALSSLVDGSTASAVTFAGGTAPLVLEYDLGSAQEVNNLVVGSGSSLASWPGLFSLAFSDDNVLFALEQNSYGVPYPGANALAAQASTNRWSLADSWVTAVLIGDGTFADGIGGTTAAQPSRVLTGKTQVEFEVVTDTDPGLSKYFGGFTEGHKANLSGASGNDLYSWSYRSNGQLYYGGGNVASYGDTWTQGDFIGMVIDHDAHTATFYKNGVSQGVIPYPVEPSKVWPSMSAPSSNMRAAVRLAGFAFPIAGAQAWAPAKTLKAAGFQVRSETGLSSRRNQSLERPGFVQVRSVDPLHQAGKPFGSFFGDAFIVGTVKKKDTPVNTPLRRKVRCYREFDGLLVGETWSDLVTGAYRFNYLVANLDYTVLAYDYENNFRATVADGLNLANGGAVLV